MSQATFPLHADLLQDACRGAVVDVAGSGDSVQVELPEAEAQQRQRGLGGVTAPPDVGMQTVAEEASAIVRADHVQTNAADETPTDRSTIASSKFRRGRWRAAARARLTKLRLSCSPFGPHGMKRTTSLRLA